MVFVLLRITKSATAYDHAAYAALPSLGDARNMFISHGADNAVNGELKDILVKRGLTDKFGLALLHSHAEIQSHERLAHLGDSAIPISMKETPSTLFPCTWKVTNGRLLPFDSTSLCSTLSPLRQTRNDNSLGNRMLVIAHIV